MFTIVASSTTISWAPAIRNSSIPGWTVRRAVRDPAVATGTVFVTDNSVVSWSLELVENANVS
jgi:hypothetical protein